MEPHRALTNLERTDGMAAARPCRRGYFASVILDTQELAMYLGTFATEEEALAKIQEAWPLLPVVAWRTFQQACNARDPWLDDKNDGLEKEEEEEEKH